MEILIYVLIGFSILTLIAAIPLTIRSIANCEQRSMSLQLIAKQANLQFQRHDAHEYAGFCSDFELMSHRQSNYNNSIFGRYQDVDVAVFDYFYDGRTDSSSTNQTVFMIRSDKIEDLPSFRICPMGLLESISSMMGRNVKFENDREFSKSFFLKAANETDVTELFDQQLRNFFIAKRNITCEANRGTFIWYRHARTIRAEQFDQFWEEGFAAYQKLVDRINAVSHPSITQAVPLGSNEP